MQRNYFIQTFESSTIISFEENGTKYSFSETPGNRHYEEYLEWLAEGNEPEVIDG